jgi:hypothetical protein
VRGLGLARVAAGWGKGEGGGQGTRWLTGW